MTVQCQIINGRAEDIPIEAIRECHSLICDPPFSEKVHSSAVSNGVQGQARSRDLPFAHCSTALRRTIARAAANVQRWSCIFTDWESLWLWRFSVLAAGGQYIRPVPWSRWTQPQNSGDRPGTGTECVAHFWGSAAGKKQWNGLGGLRVYDTKSLHDKDKYSCEKPIGLMLTLVSWYSRPGDWVLDLTAGVGTTAKACQLLDRNCIAVEASPGVAERAERRLASTLSERDQKLVDLWVAESYERRMAEKCATTLRLKDGTKKPNRAALERRQRCLDDLEIVKGKLA